MWEGFAIVQRREEVEGLDRIGRVMDLVKAHLSHALRADGEGLQLMEAHVLRIILAGGGCSQLDVVRETRRDKAQIGKLVASLVARGLLTKGADPSDGRRQLLALTSAGERVARQSLRQREIIADKLFAAVSADELQSLLGTLARLEARLSQDLPAS